MAIHLDLMILKLLSKDEMYGYQIVSELKKISDEYFSLQTGTVYPLLRTMVTDNSLQAFEKEYAGKKRTYYRITQLGRQKLNEGTHRWILFSEAVNKVLNS